MQAKKCDRCKKLYEYYENQNRFNAAAMIRINDVGVISRDGPHYDLCPECMNKFDKFLNGKDDLNIEKEGHKHD